MNIKDILNTVSNTKIVIYGIVITLTAVFVVQALLVTPIAEQLHTDRIMALAMDQELQTMTSQQTQILDSIPDSSELPQVLDSIKHSLELNGTAVNSMQTTQLSVKEDSTFSQAMIKITLNGDRRDIIRLTGEIIQESGYPLILEELEITDNRIDISLMILIKKEISI